MVDSDERKLTLLCEQDKIEKMFEVSRHLPDKALLDFCNRVFESSRMICESFRQLNVNQQRVFENIISSALEIKNSAKQGNIREPGYLSTKDVSKLLGISPQSVRKWCESNKLKATRTFGNYGEWRISTEQFKRSEEMRLRYEKLVKEKCEGQLKTHKALKELDLTNSFEYKDYIKEITRDED